MEEEKRNINKSRSRLSINLSLLAICFTLFTFIVAINPTLLKENIFLSIQLTVAIPLLITSIFARTKLGYTTKNVRVWNKYGFITFMLGYGFLVNSIGILLSSIVSLNLGMVFFGANFLSLTAYSFMEVAEDRSKIINRVKKDGLFILIILLGGILPSFKIY
jgi:hypothetical protein